MKERSTERVKVNCSLSKMLGSEGLECSYLDFGTSALSLLDEHNQRNLIKNLKTFFCFVFLLFCLFVP